MNTFIKLTKKNRNLLFSKVKQNIHLSWEKFYPSLGISRSMFFNYLSGKHNLPESIFTKILKISKIQKISYEKISREKYALKNITFPKEDVFLAESFGVLNGDGHLSPINHEISVVGNLLEEEYFDYLKLLFEKTEHAYLY